MSEENQRRQNCLHTETSDLTGVRDTWYWKLSKTGAGSGTFVIRTRNAYIHYGGFKGMYRRWKQKKRRSVQASGFWNKIFPECRGET